MKIVRTLLFAPLLFAGCVKAELEQAKIDMAQTQIKQLTNAADLYRLKKGEYPTKEQGLAVLAEEKILENVPVDPWGTAYDYSPGKIVSAGPDKTLGTKDDVAPATP
jgi:general secretion pathway protein G